MPKDLTRSTYSPQRGQALLVIVLIMVVALTVGLSIATRSLTNTRVSTEEQNSQQAFSAAEAGVERMLKSTDTQPVPDTSLNNGSIYNASLQPVSQTELVLNGGATVAKDDGIDLWLSDYDTNQPYKNPQTGTYTIYWEQVGSCTNADPTPAVEIVLLSGTDISSAKATHFVYDSCGTRANNYNHFSTAVNTVTKSFAGTSNQNWITGTITVTDPGFIARIIPLYANSKIAVTGPKIPSQGKQIVSTGKAGGTVRKISVYQQNPRLPIEIFPYAIFAPDNS